MATERVIEVTHPLVQHKLGMLRDVETPTQLFRQLVNEQGRDDILITGGGIIPREDMEALQAQGIGRLFGPGTPTTELIDYIKDWFATREAQDTTTASK